MTTPSDSEDAASLAGLRALVICTRDPRGRMTGRKAVLATIVDSLQRLSVRVVVAYFGPPGVDTRPAASESVNGALSQEPLFVKLPEAGTIERIGGGLRWLFAGRPPLSEALYRSRSAAAVLFDLIARQGIDVVVTDMVRTAWYAENSGLPWIADLDDLLSRRYRWLAVNPEAGRDLMGYHDSRLARTVARHAAGALPWILRREAASLEARERQIASRADVTSLVSAVEAQLLATETGLTVFSTPMAVRGPDDYLPPSRRRQEMAFLGGLDYGPNLACVLDFDRVLRPALVQQGIEDPRLHVIGYAAEADRLVSDSVHFEGYREDLDAAVQEFRTMLIPEVPRGGIKTKIIVAALNGTVVLAHDSATEGIGLTQGRNALVWHDVTELARLIQRIRAGSLDLDAIAKDAREWAQERFGPEALCDKWSCNLRAALCRDRTG